MAKCAQCFQPLSGQYYKAEHLKFHVACFVCAHCQRPIDQGFTLKKGKIYHAACYMQARQIPCAHCGQALPQKWIELNGKKYHQTCYQSHYQLRCTHCQGLISGTYSKDETGPYHPQCYRETRLTPCDACGQALEGKYLQDIWGNQTHLKHGGKKTPQCHVCARLISQNTSQGGVRYGDGRYVCGLCQITEVTTPHQVERLKKDVLQELHHLGFTDIPEYVSVTLSDQKTLNKRLQNGKHANSHGYTQTLERTQEGELFIEHSIFVLYGLPQVLFKGVLAHEFIHVWLNERRLHHLAPKTVEGFCNLSAAWIYQNDQTPLGDVLLNRLETDPNPVYGDGYRKMKRALIQKGWEQLISELAHSQPSRFQRFLDFTDRLI